MRKGWVLGAATAVAAVVMVSLAMPRLRSARTAKLPDVAACSAAAKPANLNFTLNDLDGKEVKLADYKGKVVLLDFWATWCAPCKVEIPAFISLYNKYRSRGLEVVSVVLLDRFVNAKPYAQQMRMNYPVLDGEAQQDKIDDAYGPLFGLPMSFLIARDGRVCQKHLGLPGAKDGTEPDEKAIREIFEAEIKALL